MKAHSLASLLTYIIVNQSFDAFGFSSHLIGVQASIQPLEVSSHHFGEVFAYPGGIGLPTECCFYHHELGRVPGFVYQ